MTTIKITETIAAEINTVREAGKTPWVIINEDYLVGIYNGRNEARTAKAEHNYTGKIAKADEVEFEVIKLPPVEQPKAAEAVKAEIVRLSTATRPCKLVWEIAENMTKQNARRKDIIAECVNQGVAYYTARTQYQLWLTIKKEERERELLQASKAKR